MGSNQMTERQVLDAVMADAIKTVFDEYVDKHGLEEIAEIFGKGVKIEVGDMLPSAEYARVAAAGSAGHGTRRSRSTPRRMQPCERRASSLCWQDCTRWTGFHVRSTTDELPTRHDRRCSLRGCEKIRRWALASGSRGNRGLTAEAIYFGCRARSAGVPPATDCRKLTGGTPAIRTAFGTFGAEVDGIVLTRHRLISLCEQSVLRKTELVSFSVVRSGTEQAPFYDSLTTSERTIPSGGTSESVQMVSAGGVTARGMVLQISCRLYRGRFG